MEELIGTIIVRDLPAICLLVVGFALLVVEMYIPGFGVPGILGATLLVTGIILKANGSWVAGLITALVMVALLCVALSFSIHSISKGRLAKSRFVLNEVAVSNEVAESDMRYFVGREGVVKTTLRPAGMGEFDGVKLNIVSDGEFIQNGGRVRVDRVEGNRIVVSQVRA